MKIIDFYFGLDMYFYIIIFEEEILIIVKICIYELWELNSLIKLIKIWWRDFM